MDEAALLDDIAARIAADTGTGGLRNADSPLISAGVPSDDVGPARRGHPYVEFQIAAVGNSDCFAVDVREVMVYFAVYADKANGRQTPSDIRKRLHELFHRHDFGAVGDWSSTSMFWVDSATNHSDSTFNFTEVYKLFLSKSV